MAARRTSSDEGEARSKFGGEAESVKAIRWRDRLRAQSMMAEREAERRGSPAFGISRRSMNNTTMADASSQVPGEFEEMVLLATLKLQPRAYGVAIQEVIERATKSRVNVRGLYTTLKRLRDKQWVRDFQPRGGTKNPAGPARRYYRVSSAGRLALRMAARDRIRRNSYIEALAKVGSPADAVQGKEIVYG